MSTVVTHNAVSVDGFIADESDDVGPLHDWYYNGDVPLTEGGGTELVVEHRFKVSAASAEFVRPMWEGMGTTVDGPPPLRPGERLGRQATGG